MTEISEHAVTDSIESATVILKRGYKYRGFEEHEPFSLTFKTETLELLDHSLVWKMGINFKHNRRNLWIGIVWRLSEAMLSNERITIAAGRKKLRRFMAEYKRTHSCSRN